MARPVLGQEVLEVAQRLLATVREANQLRILQAVILPLAYGMSIKHISEIVGKSIRWVSGARKRFIDNTASINEPNKCRLMRSRAHMTLEQEKAFLAPFFENACKGGILVVNTIHKELEQHLGRKVALATAYNLLHRHGWRKLTPDKRHVEADVQAQDDWKKNFPK